MSTLLNTLFLLKQGSYARLDQETVRIEFEGKTDLRVPLIHLGGIAVFGNVLLSPALIHAFADKGRSLALFDRNGRFKARLVGGTTGNVLLRRAQHEALGAKTQLAVARNLIAGKLRNSRQVLLRGARDTADETATGSLKQAAEVIKQRLSNLESAVDLETVRGIEGDAARNYYEAFPNLLRSAAFTFDGRNRRPPRDPVNALLSFLYGLLRNDCASALEGVGLDPQVGFLHALRPGRPALALDLMEEFRSVIADRLALTLVNRGQLSEKDFNCQPGSAGLNDDGRRKVIVAYQKRKQEELNHPLLERKVLVGLLPHTQARILARFLRGDLEHYVPFLWR